ncbi:TonB-dependent receptor plug domain-containing protein [Asaia lannensis]|uniref:TonB-dependent receptor plug domain-containing protein n=1 Tax=Asaia lannensis TaxID=415421 RepID=UPI0035E90FCC
MQRVDVSNGAIRRSYRTTLYLRAIALFLGSTTTGLIVYADKAKASRNEAAWVATTPSKHPDTVRMSTPVRETKAGKTRSASASDKNRKNTVLSADAGKNSSPAERIFVTGTRLTQSRLSSVMAGSTLDDKQIALRGYNDLGLALLRENPAVSVGDNSPLGAQNLFGAGQSFVSLLNLGSQRTLTLVDGMRMGGGATASIYGVGSGSQVDVSTLPTSLIKTVDTRLGGAGAAYGADAVAGVINYTLDDHYKGVSLESQGGWSQQLDAASEKNRVQGRNGV